MHCCRALTLALAKLSCNYSNNYQLAQCIVSFELCRIAELLLTCKIDHQTKDIHTVDSLLKAE